ncbi:MAG: FHA domain-containing protein [Gemmataceae bacterium]
MPRFHQIYFHAVFGALGGLLGWLLFCVFGSRVLGEESLLRQLLFDGAWIGGGIGYFVVSSEAIRDRSLLRFLRLASYGLLMGAMGGAVGMVVAERVNFLMVGGIGAIRGDTFRFVLTVLIRGFGFLFLGLAVGLSEGIASRSWGQVRYGSLGGAMGGFLGGCLFGLVYLLTLQGGGDAALAGALGLMIMGACIGGLSALVQGVFQPATIRVLRGWQEGREYPLVKDKTWIGRDEHADIALFRDMKIEKKHVLIHRQGDRCLLYNQGAPGDFTRVNDVPITQHCELRDGDRIQLGQVLLRYQLRKSGGMDGVDGRSITPSPP